MRKQKKGKTEKLIATKTKCDEMKWQKGQRVCHRRTQSVTEIHFVLRLNIYFASIDARFTVLNLHLTIRDARIAIAVDDRQLCTLFQMELRDDPIKMGSTKKKKNYRKNLHELCVALSPFCRYEINEEKLQIESQHFFVVFSSLKMRREKRSTTCSAGQLEKQRKAKKKQTIEIRWTSVCLTTNAVVQQCSRARSRSRFGRVHQNHIRFFLYLNLSRIFFSFFFCFHFFAFFPFANEFQCLAMTSHAGGDISSLVFRVAFCCCHSHRIEINR